MGDAYFSTKATAGVSSYVDHWFFLYGFGKNERSNINEDELKAFQEMAAEFLGLNDKQLETALNSGMITEVHNGNNEAHKPYSERNA